MHLVVLLGLLCSKPSLLSSFSLLGVLNIAGRTELYAKDLLPDAYHLRYSEFEIQKHGAEQPFSIYLIDYIHIA